MADKVLYRSEVRIERVKGPFRRAYLPIAEEPIHFGVHDEIAQHYKTDLTVHEPRDATLDYVVASTAG